jgi:PHD/YefM family antitoxin component YafN of YafNO toxin-antitoxin module
MKISTSTFRKDMNALLYKLSFDNERLVLFNKEDRPVAAVLSMSEYEEFVLFKLKKENEAKGL